MTVANDHVGGNSGFDGIGNQPYAANDVFLGVIFKKYHLQKTFLHFRIVGGLKFPILQ